MEMSPSPTPIDDSFSSLAPLPDERIILGCGAVSLDYLATVASFPKPNEKVRSISLEVQGGGNAGNAFTCAARLGLTPRLISKVTNDSIGRSLLAELAADGVETSYIVVAEEGNSQITYVIVDNQTKTRTCIYTPAYPPMVLDDISQSRLFSSLDGVRLAYFEGRLHEPALVIAKEAFHRRIPILIDAERKKDGLDDLLNLAQYVVCSAEFPQTWTTAPSVPSALVSMLLRLPRIKFLIVTLGEDGCVMLERNENEEPELEEMEIDTLLASLNQRIDSDKINPTCISSEPMKLNACGIGKVTGRLHVGTAEKIPPPELIDTTGAGDAFIGAIMYSICAEMPPEKMLPFASQVAAIGCRALGARAGLPRRTDPRLSPFLQTTSGSDDNA